MTGARRTLGRDTDYLGVISEQLANLTGFATLANELLQNADDARATRVEFRVRPDALVVYNDSVFKPCEDPELPECPWLATKNFPCDFHSFRLVGARQKRERAGTTGAFGVGFIAVYQITDRPQLLSSGRNWTLYEEKPADERIRVAPYPKGVPSEGTTFVLPWAADASSVLRSKLHVPPFLPHQRQPLLEEIAAAAPVAQLFLKHIVSIAIRDDDRTIATITRGSAQADYGERVTISSGIEVQDWLIVDGDFDAEAAELRARYGDVIEQKRGSRVRVACRRDKATAGLLFASLPTQHATQLPFHIQADFFPSTDRKRVILESGATQDFKSQWNRSAIRAAAAAMADAIEPLAHDLGPAPFWAMIPQIQRAAIAARDGALEESLASFRDEIWPAMASATVAYTNRDEWVAPGDAPIIETPDEAKTAGVLDGLGLPTMHEDLRSFVFPRSQEIGTRLLEVADLATAMRHLGLVDVVDMSDLAPPLDSADGRSLLWSWVASRLKRRTGPSQADQDALTDCALIPTLSGRLAPSSHVYRADLETARIFTSIPGIEFIDSAELGDAADALSELCVAFSADQAVGELADWDSDAILAAWHAGDFDAIAVLDWFATKDRTKDLGQLKQEIADLPIFPTKSSLEPLEHLALPGDFEDPIGLADILDVGLMQHLVPFLIRLGAKRLSLETYLIAQLPKALVDDELDAELLRAIVDVIAAHLPQLRGNEGVRLVLQGLPILETENDGFCRATDVYFRTMEVGRVLGTDHPFVVRPVGREEATEDLLRWLGVADRARVHDVIERVKRVVAKPPTANRIRQVLAIIEDLHERRSDPMFLTLLGGLAGLDWLPAKGDHEAWHASREIYAGFRSYLFESQARFLAFSIPQQVQIAATLEKLGIQTNPSPGQVVDHLLWSSANKKPVNREVYSYLSQNVSDPEIARLVDTPCVLLAEYELPAHLFWDAHPFGQYRHRLAESMRAQDALFTRLGVRDRPDWHDAVDVLIEIAESAGSSPVSDEKRIVVQSCWQMLAVALDDEGARASVATLGEARVVLDGIGVLVTPDSQYFEDRPALAEKFGPELSRSIIPREAGAWFAMALAGVRDLSSVTRGRVVEATNPRDDPSVESRIRERWTQVARCADPLGSFEAFAMPRYQRVDRLVIQWIASIGTKQYHADPEQPAGFHDLESSIFYFAPTTERSIPWAAVARELVLTLRPLADSSTISSIAAAVKAVLAAGSLDAARHELDELGYPPLSDATVIDLDSHGEAEGLGGVELDDPIDVPVVEDDWSDDGDVTDHVGTPAVGQDGGEGRSASDLEASLDSNGKVSDGPPGTGSANSSDGLGRLQAASDIATGRETGVPDRERGDGSPRYTLRSFVQYGPVSDAFGDSTDDRSPVDTAGIKHVLQYEASQGRLAIEMPHDNPGYDIESTDEAGDVRYIEVKSMSGFWADGPVGMSHTQFDAARDGGEDFWFYVVERAESDIPVLHRFRDPARRVTHYVYDDGWKQVAEIDEEEELGEVS